jgi:hypothetical protein
MDYIVCESEFLIITLWCHEWLHMFLVNFGNSDLSFHIPPSDINILIFFSIEDRSLTDLLCNRKEPLKPLILHCDSDQSESLKLDMQVLNVLWFAT